MDSKQELTRSSADDERIRERLMVRILERILWVPVFAVVLAVAFVGVWEAWKYVHWVITH